MATHLLPTLQGALTPALTHALAQGHGLSHATLQGAHETWMALLLAALAHRGIGEDGARAVRKLLGSEAMNEAGRAVTAFGAAPGADTMLALSRPGHQLVSELLGEQRVGRVTLALAAVSGLAASTAQSLAWALGSAGLSALLPVMARPLHGDDAALQALLRAQAASLDKQLDARLTTAAGLGSPSALLNALQAGHAGLSDGPALRLAPAAAGPVATPSTAPAPARRWWLGGLAAGVIVAVVAASQWATRDSRDRLTDALPHAQASPDAAVNPTTDTSAGSLDASPAPAAGTRKDGLQAQVYFEVGQSLIGNEGQQRLATVREWLAADATRQVAITGYTDTSGDPELNQALAHARALGVRQALQDAGIAASRLVMHPPETVTLPADTPAAQARRVELVGL